MWTRFHESGSSNSGQKVCSGSPELCSHCNPGFHCSLLTLPLATHYWPTRRLPSLSSFAATLPPPQQLQICQYRAQPTGSSLGSAQTPVMNLLHPVNAGCLSLIQPRSCTPSRVKPCQFLEGTAGEWPWNVGASPRSCLGCWSILPPSVAMGCQGWTLKLFVNECLYPSSLKLFRRLIQISTESGVILKNYWSSLAETY